MSVFLIVLTVASALTVIANIVVRSLGASWAAFWLKTACGLLFTIVGIRALAGMSLGEATEPYLLITLGACIVGGLVLGLAGDVALALKDLLPHEFFNKFLMAGFVFFAAGHVAYIAGLLRGWRTPVPWLPVVICLAISVGFVVADKVLKLEFGKFKWVVAAYGFMLTLMVAIGFFTAATGEVGSSVVLTSGPNLMQPFVMGWAGVAFLISDLVLAWTYFGPAKNRPWEHAVCYVFYYAAQFGIASSLFLV